MPLYWNILFEQHLFFLFSQDDHGSQVSHQTLVRTAIMEGQTDLYLIC